MTMSRIGDGISRLYKSYQLNKSQSEDGKDQSKSSLSSIGRTALKSMPFVCYFSKDVRKGNGLRDRVSKYTAGIGSLVCDLAVILFEGLKK